MTTCESRTRVFVVCGVVCVTRVCSGCVLVCVQGACLVCGLYVDVQNVPVCVCKTSA